MTWVDLIQRSRAENRLFSVLLELTYRCNWDCVFCYNDLGLQGTPLRKDQYLQLLADLRQLGVFNLVLTGGEPLAHPDFLEIGDAARAGGFVVRLKTNGHALRGSLARQVKERVDPFVVEVSLHGATAQVHDRQTRVPGSFDRLLDNLVELKQLGFRLKINSVLTIWNEYQVRDMFRIADDLGIPIHIEPEVTPRDDGDQSPLNLAPTEQGVRDLFTLLSERTEAAPTSRSVSAVASSQAVDKETVDGEIASSTDTSFGSSRSSQSSERPNKHCGAGSSALAIDPMGNVYPCVQWRRPAGNLHNRSIAEIWGRSPVLEEVRELTVAVSEKFRALGVDTARRMAFCPGSAELHTGDPLSVYAPAEKRLEAYRASSVRSLPVVTSSSPPKQS